VHPGEEGFGRKLFPARISFDKESGIMMWEPPVVRLIGSPSFYERRRKNLSWQQWISRMEKQMADTCLECKKGKATMAHPNSSYGDNKKAYCCVCYWQINEDLKYEGGREQRIAHQEYYRNMFFPIVLQVIQENKDTLIECGMMHRNVTAGKIVSALLEKSDAKNLDHLLNKENYNELAHQIYNMYELVFDQEKRKDALYPITYSRVKN
jgi:hypothetical protein